MKYFTVCWLLAICMHLVVGQNNIHYQASLGENGIIHIDTVSISDENSCFSALKKEGYQQLENWPRILPAHPNFKNFRGVTLADITQNGQDEILVATFNKLYAFEGSGNLLWSLNLTGTAVYPPSVADVTGNGEPDIVQLTGGIPNNGRAYLVDKTGQVQSGWPVSVNNNWLLSAPTLADLDNNGQMEIIFGVRTLNEIHVVKADGSPFSDHWPAKLSAVPAFTPSVGDINNDGEPNIIAGSSDGFIYAFNLEAELLEGFPVAGNNTGLSYQSPLLADFDKNNQLSIVGTTTGDSPVFYIRNSDGSYREGWPIPTGMWTYHPPTIADINQNGNYEVFMARPTGESISPMLYGFTPEGQGIEHFPIEKAGGLESFISVADIDGDGKLELLFGANLMAENGYGYIHAYKTDGSGELPGFPLRPKGFTYMNGANLGDVTGDGMLNLVALSWEQTFSATDSILINVYDLNITAENVQFATYKGSNTRTGFMHPASEEPDPDVYASFRFVNACDEPAGQNLQLWYNDSLLLENANFGFASDLLSVRVNDPFLLSLQAEGQTHREVVYEQMLDMQEDDLWLVAFAGKHQENQDKDFSPGFYIYHDFRQEPESENHNEFLFFDAYTNTEYAADYVLFPDESDALAQDNFMGQFWGYLPFHCDYMHMHVLYGAQAHQISYSYYFSEPQGNAFTFVIASAYDNNFPITSKPVVTMLPAEAGYLLYPDEFVNNLITPDASSSAFRVYPNPATDHINILLPAYTNDDLQIHLYNLMGKRVVSYPITMNQSDNSIIQLPLYQIPSGVYILKGVVDESYNFNTKLIIK